MAPWLWLTLSFLGQQPPPSDVFHGWQAERDHRFVWIQDRQKVGETLLRWTPLKSADKSPPTQWKIESRRSYDRPGNSQRATSSTVCDSAGRISTYEDSVELTANVGKKASQQTTIEIKGEKARVSYRQSGKAEPPMEASLPDGARLAAAQAIEHWILFLSQWPRESTDQVQKLFYPDFGKVLSVAFKKVGDEKLRIGSGEITATKLTFDAAKDSLSGAVWLDSASRMVQIEFLNALKPELSLRVTLAEDSPRKVSK